VGKVTVFRFNVLLDTRLQEPTFARRKSAWLFGRLQLGKISPALPVESGLPVAYQSSVTNTRKVKVPASVYNTPGEKLTV
jgi:hypothetical protein